MYLVDPLPPFTITDSLEKQQRKLVTKWLQISRNWTLIKDKKVRQRCYVFKGVPSIVRPYVWKVISGSYKIMVENKEKYKELLAGDCGEQVSRCIELDRHRTLRTHPLFEDAEGIGQTALANILKAYSVCFPETG